VRGSGPWAKNIRKRKRGNEVVVKSNIDDTHPKGNFNLKFQRGKVRGREGIRRQSQCSGAHVQVKSGHHRLAVREKRKLLATEGKGEK